MLAHGRGERALVAVLGEEAAGGGVQVPRPQGDEAGLRIRELAGEAEAAEARAARPGRAPGLVGRRPRRDAAGAGDQAQAAEPVAVGVLRDAGGADAFLESGRAEQVLPRAVGDDLAQAAEAQPVPGVGGGGRADDLLDAVAVAVVGVGGGGVVWVVKVRRCSGVAPVTRRSCLSAFGGRTDDGGAPAGAAGRVATSAPRSRFAA